MKKVRAVIYIVFLAGIISVITVKQVCLIRF